MEDIQRIRCLREKLINHVETALAMPVGLIDAEELGQLVDMVKDLAEAEKCLCGYSQKHYQYMVPASEEYYPQQNSSDSYRDTEIEYETARRHYHETKSIDDKRVMEDRANEHVQKAMHDIRDIWTEADPTMKQKIKNSVNTLMNEMK